MKTTKLRDLTATDWAVDKHFPSWREREIVYLSEAPLMRVKPPVPIIHFPHNI